jgi:hypothetical protein
MYVPVVSAMHRVGSAGNTNNSSRPRKEKRLTYVLNDADDTKVNWFLNKLCFRYYFILFFLLGQRVIFTLLSQVIENEVNCAYDIANFLRNLSVTCPGVLVYSKNVLLLLILTEFLVLQIKKKAPCCIATNTMNVPHPF